MGKKFELIAFFAMKMLAVAPDDKSKLLSDISLKIIFSNNEHVKFYWRLEDVEMSFRFFFFFLQILPHE